MSAEEEKFEIELLPVARMTLDVSDMIVVGRGPFGTRGIGEIAGSRLEGERLRAEQQGRAAADWALISDDGLLRGDIRIAWKTHDGATLFMTYVAYQDQGGYAYSAPVFETGDARYAWLNRTRFVGKGRFDREALRVTYQLYEMR